MILDPSFDELMLLLLTVDLSDIATTRAVAVAVAVAVATSVAAFSAFTELPPPVTFAPVIV